VYEQGCGIKLVLEPPALRGSELDQVLRSYTRHSSYPIRSEVFVLIVTAARSRSHVNHLFGV